MATYAIGDLQGCFEPLQRLLDQIRFDPAEDRLWFVGDLVNRGPDSLATLRYVHSLGEAAITVLGNHDLHLVAVAEGFARLKRDDTLDEILAAPDREPLLDWLRHRPLMHFEQDVAMVHAGLLPSWSVTRALELAAEVEAQLRAPGYRSFLAQMYGNQPDRWDERLAGTDRLRVIVNAMTRMRLCTVDGVMEFAHKGKPDTLPAGYLPWFAVPGRGSRDTTVIFGHWSALGLVQQPNLYGLDSGCLWGRRLSALRLDDRRVFQSSCRRPSKGKVRSR
jgi:bis(5'-nucleosyl)-tetraphosphatase (symmetrical)